MYTVKESVTITAPRRRVWDFVTEPDNVLLYNSGMLKFERQSDVLEKGSKVDADYRWMGKRLEWTAEVTEFAEAERLEYRALDGPFPFSFGWQFIDHDGGTDLTYWMEAESFGGFFGKFAEPLLVKLYTREVHAMLGKIKELIEH